MNELKVEVLMSVMHQENFDIAYKTKINSDLLIINQCDKEHYAEMMVEGHLWRMISTTQRGLSKSRNLALEKATGDICLFCDDDEELVEGYQNIILKAFEELTDATAIVFNVNRINNNLKKIYYKIAKIRRAPFYRAYGSPMLVINRHRIQKAGIRMNEKFGSGTEWGGGEDSLFEHDIRKAGLKIYEYPETIATIDYGTVSQWFKGYDEKYFYNLGAFCEYRYGKNVLIKNSRKLYTCYRLRREKGINFWMKIQWMNLGAKGIKNNVTYSKFVEEKSQNGYKA